MPDSPRDELAELSRLFAAHLDWQRELGVASVAMSIDEAPSHPTPERSRRPEAAPEVRPAAPVEPPPAKLEMPTFLRKRGDAPVPPTRAAAPPSAPAPAPATAAPTPPPSLATPPASEPLVRAPRDAWSNVLEGEARKGALRVLNDDVVECRRCRLHEGRTQTVFSRGNPFARLAFVGEGPGRDEDAQGAPFVGAAGKLLDQIIAAMGLTQDEVYVCNVVKCRPPNNRVPAPDEMASCGSFLVEQLGYVRPQAIVALGKTAASYLLQSTDAMSKLRGRWHAWQGIALLPTWHPAYLLRTPSAKKDTWEDMKLVLARLGREVPKRGGSNG